MITPPKFHIDTNQKWWVFEHVSPFKYGYLGDIRPISGRLKPLVADCQKIMAFRQSGAPGIFCWLQKCEICIRMQVQKMHMEDDL